MSGGVEIKMKVLIIDNFDSFTYNLVEDFERFGCKCFIYRNSITHEHLSYIVSSVLPSLIVLSPGPSHPGDAGICNELVKEFRGKVPILGVCLGFQCIIYSMGGEIKQQDEPVHGKKTKINYTGSEIMKGLPNPFYAGRYHSLYASQIPDIFQSTAYSGNKVMAVENPENKLYGILFHPESILTSEGTDIIKNVMEVIE